MKRREFIQRTGAGLAAAAFTPSFAAFGVNEEKPRLTPSAEIEKRVLAARPSRGGRIPADFAKRFGATHYDGRYHFTDKPYLVEGAEKMHELGMGVAKFWLREDDLPGYRYNSNWGTRGSMPSHQTFSRSKAWA